MLGFMIIFGIIGIQFVATLPVPQFYQYNTFKRSTDPLYVAPTQTEHSTSILNGNSQITNKPIQYFNKQIFIHTAPEETYDETQAAKKITNSLMKNLRVLFIKAPSNNGLTNAAEKLAKQKTSEQTIIYVLNKYTDTAELRDKLEKLNENDPNKPEVHFVRYKTNEDAEHAQNSIQSQYDNLGDGSLEVINEGVPDTISFVGLANSNQPQLQHNSYQPNQQIDFNNDQSVQTSGISLGNTQNLSNTYLPSLH